MGEGGTGTGHGGIVSQIQNVDGDGSRTVGLRRLVADEETSSWGPWNCGSNSSVAEDQEGDDDCKEGMHVSGVFVSGLSVRVLYPFDDFEAFFRCSRIWVECWIQCGVDRSLHGCRLYT